MSEQAESPGRAGVCCPRHVLHWGDTGLGGGLPATQEQSLAFEGPWGPSRKVAYQVLVSKHPWLTRGVWFKQTEGRGKGRSQEAVTSLRLVWPAVQG